MASIRTQTAFEEMVHHYTFDKPDLIPPSDGWFKKFCERNNLKTINKTLIDRERMEKGTTTRVKDWFDQIFNQKSFEQYKRELIFNADETMVAYNNKLKAVVRHSSKVAIDAIIGNKEHLTLMVAVSAAGALLTPYAIYPLKTLPPIIEGFV
jgi:UPF0716 family protein affecting phage T7 exclusion